MQTTNCILTGIHAEGRFLRIAKLSTCASLGRWLTWAAVFGGGWWGSGTAAAQAERPVDFQRDVRPLLSEYCFACHGPDEATREADLRLDVAAAAYEDRGGQAAVVPGNPDESLLIERIEADDPDLRMPPPASAKDLTDEQRNVLRRWIAGGGAFEQHWAFRAPERPPLPAAASDPWVRNPIDAFVLDRLRKQGMAPSPRAAPRTLLRRLSLDLIGLPPEPETMASALASSDEEEAYRASLDHLLGSVHFGERWGRWWLDAARYADSDGFEKDKPRQVWFYRDWVIDALNRDLPYNEFVVQQIAGDLLDGAGQRERVATGFLRNSMQNEEGGVDPEQFRMEAMYDRMDAIGKAVLGLTIQCSQCHSHKYDPLQHREYYALFAYLNNCHESFATVYTAEEQAQREQVLAEIKQIEDQIKQERSDWSAQLEQWVQRERGRRAADWQSLRLAFDDNSIGGQKMLRQADGSYLCQSYAPTLFAPWGVAISPLDQISAVRLEMLTDPNLPHGGPGRSTDGTAALTEFKLQVAPADQPDAWRDVEWALATADGNPPEQELAAQYDDRSGRRRVTGPIGFAIDGDDTTAWGTDLGPGRRNVPRHAVFQLAEPLTGASGSRLRVTLVQRHGGWNSDDNMTNSIGRFRVSVTDRANAVADPIPASTRALFEIPAEQRTEEQTAALFTAWRTTVPDLKEKNRLIEQAWQRHPAGHSQLVVQERHVVRPTYRLERGDFLKPAEQVQPGVPSFLHPLPHDAGTNRLAFAQWLVDARSPTTARAVVNRIWQAYFGRGIVDTPDDFGLQGSPPTHPELLDWLAVELMEHGWSLKHIHRLIAESATYQQSSVGSPEQLAEDPDNRWLARGPRVRVDAEIVRDVALSASGLLNPEVGGPSVYPPAPAFLFEPPVSYGPKTWKHQSDAESYRRAIYTFRFRSVPYPMLQTFDGPTGEVACVRRPQSNTPLQALVTLNEPLFVECARSLARITCLQAGADPGARLQFAFERCLNRPPSAEEQRVLLSLIADEEQRFAAQPDAAWKLLNVPEVQRPELPAELTPANLAAWTVAARVILNLDEMITKE